MDFVEVETAGWGRGPGKVGVVNRIERAAKERDTTWMMFSGGAVRLRGGQCVSVEEPCSLFCGGSWSKSSEEWVAFGMLSKASATARTRSLTPVPAAAEIE